MQYNEIEKELDIKRYKLLIPNYNDEVFIYTINDSFMFDYHNYRPDISIDLNNFPVVMYCIKKLSKRLSKFLDIEKIKEGLVKHFTNNVGLMMDLRIISFYHNNYIPTVSLYGFSTDDKDKIEYKFSFYWYISKEIALDISNTCILNINGKIDYLNKDNEISFFNDKTDLIERSYVIDNNIDSIINFIFTLLNLKRDDMKYASIK